jgi:hypothetical protein
MSEHDSWQRATLQGLEGVGIRVEAGNLGLGPEEEEAFHRGTYRAVERLLRGGNVPVLLSFEEMALSPSGGLLTVAASLQGREGSDWAALTLYTELTQSVRLARSSQLSPAVTWRAVGTALVSMQGWEASATEGIRAQVRLFLADYQAAQAQEEA